MARPRLFCLLDRCLTRPATWVNGPAGAGKTALISSYLAQRSLPHLWYRLAESDADPATFFHNLGLAVEAVSPAVNARVHLPVFASGQVDDVAAFARGYFRLALHGLPAGTVLVLDDLDGVRGALKEILDALVAELPRGIRAIFVARAAPADWVRSLRVHNRLSVLGWRSLRLTDEEADAFVARYRGAAASEAAHSLNAQTRGWVMGLLLALQTEEGDFIGAGRGEALQYIFEYFSDELLSRIDPDRVEFLLAAGHLPQMTPVLAAELTGRTDARELLADLHANSWFLDARPGSEPRYEFHPLFRQFLRRAARARWEKEAVAAVEKTAGEALRRHGLLEEAGRLFREAGDEGSLLGLAVDHAPDLLAAGKDGLLEEWLCSVSEPCLHRNDWALYWLGRLRLTRDRPAARRLLTEAYRGFEAWGEHRGLLLAWCSVVQSYVYGLDNLEVLDRWIAAIEEVLAANPAFPSVEIEAGVAAVLHMALVLRQPGKEQVARWGEWAAALRDRIEDPVIRALDVLFEGANNLWTGDFRRNAGLVENVRSEFLTEDAPAVLRIVGHLLDAQHAWYMGEAEACRRAVQKGLAIAEAEGIHLWDTLLLMADAHGAFITADPAGMDDALQCLQEVLGRANTLAHVHYYLLAAWRAVLRGAYSQALSYLDMAEDANHRLRVPFHSACWNLLMAQVFLAREEWKTAGAHLSAARALADRMGSELLLYSVQLLEARAFLAQGKEEAGLSSLRQALGRGWRGGYAHFVGWDAAAMAELCARALEDGTEVDYVRELVRRRRLVAPNLYVTDAWPWPLRIYTLGRFEVWRDAERLDFGPHTPRRVLDLLKLTVAAGQGGLSYTSVCDLLWPEADGDAAVVSLQSTVYRLRKLLGVDGAVRVEDRVISLCSTVVFVDAWAFERVFQEATDLRVQEDPARKERYSRLLERALALYQGHFLSADDAPMLCARTREGLRMLFSGAVRRYGRVLEDAGRLSRAIDRYERALVMDECSEGIYQNLMRCYHQKGLRAEAVATYRRCRRALEADLGITPSAETEELLRQIAK